MLNIGPQELLLILVVALVVVGPRRLPELGRTLGRGIRELRKAQDEVRKTIQVTLDEDERPAFADDRGRQSSKDGADRDGSGTDVAAPAAAASATTASEPGAAEPVSEISRTLGRSLAELRRAREEIQRSFRVDLEGPAPTPSRRTPAPGRGPARAPGDAPEAPVDPGEDASPAE